MNLELNRVVTHQPGDGLLKLNLGYVNSRSREVCRMQIGDPQRCGRNNSYLLQKKKEIEKKPPLFVIADIMNWYGTRTFGSYAACINFLLDPRSR